MGTNVYVDAGSVGRQAFGLPESLDGDVHLAAVTLGEFQRRRYEFTTVVYRTVGLHDPEAVHRIALVDVGVAACQSHVLQPLKRCMKIALKLNFDSEATQF